MLENNVEVIFQHLSPLYIYKNRGSWFWVASKQFHGAAYFIGIFATKKQVAELWYERYFPDDRFSHLFAWKFSNFHPHFTRTVSLTVELPSRIHEGSSRSRLECAARCRDSDGYDHFQFEESHKNCILLGQDEGCAGACLY